MQRFDTDYMTRRAIPTAAAILSIALTAAACSESSTPPEVVLEAHWQCDVQRLAFDDLSAMDAELESRIDAAGMTTDEYAAFKDQLGTSADLRVAVAAEYDSYCLEGSATGSPTPHP